MPPTTPRSPSLELGNRTATARMEEQDGAAIGGSHLPKLGPEALVVRIALAASFPRQPVDLLGAGLDALLRLQLQVKLHGLLQPLASRLVTLARSGAAAELDEHDGHGEEDEEAENVRGLEVVVKRGAREEDREGVEDVGEVGGEEEGAGEEDENEYEEVERGRRRVLAEQRVGIRVRVRGFGLRRSR